MKIFFCGDIHGILDDIIKVDLWCEKQEVDFVIQVGDFGINWPGQPCKITKYFEKRFRQKKYKFPWIFSPGNHDNYLKYEENIEKEQKNVNLLTENGGLIPYAGGALYSVTRPGMIYLAKSSKEDEQVVHIAFCGGAVSSDVAPNNYHDGRKPNINWWWNECPSVAEINGFFNLIEKQKPEIIVTHDGPSQGITWPLKGHGTNPYTGLPFNYLQQQFSNILQHANHKPEAWFFGHHHQLTMTDNLYCCGLGGQGWLYDTETKTSIKFETKEGQK